ncbi:MAG: protein-export chaperone SecB [Pseudomonadota bacterium]
MSEAPQQQLIIERIYLKDLSYEAPYTPEVFQQQEWQPEPSLDLHHESSQIAEDTHEVILKISVTMKHSQKIAFIAEIKQAGIFTISGYNQDQLNQILGIVAPNIIYPYARETIADLVMRGGFPQLNLAPMNFEAMYMQQNEDAPATKANNDED